MPHPKDLGADPPELTIERATADRGLMAGSTERLNANG
jgi:hypothetical protein